MNHKNIFILGLVVLVIMAVPAARATDATSSEMLSVQFPLNLPEITQKLPAPLINFVKSVSQIGEGLTFKPLETQTNAVSPRGIWESINNWIQKNFGISLTQILRAIGNLIIWILDLFIQLIRSVISVI